MSKENISKTNKVLKSAGIAVAALLVGVAGAVAVDKMTSPDVDVLVAEAQEIAYAEGVDSVELPNVEALEAVAFEEGVASVVIPEPEVITNNVTVEIDNGNLDLVLDEIYDRDGDVEFLLDDLDDDEVSQVVDRIIFKNEAKALAEELVKSEVVEYIDDEEDIFGRADLREYRDNDVYSVSVDSDDSVFEVSDFDDKEATVYVEAKLKLDNDDDKTTVYVIAEVEVEGDNVEIVNVELKE